MFKVNRPVNRLANHAVTPACPKCGREIPGDEVNAVRDIAYCRGCNLAHQLSTLVQAAQLDANVNVQDPPKGAWYREAASGVNLGATHRSFGAALGVLAISLFWNGIVSIFVLLAISATLQNLDIPAPAWFPAPKSDGEPMGPGMTIFLWVFLTPFITIGAVMIGYLLSSIAGKTEVRIGQDHGTVFTGIGPIGRRRRFNLGTVTEVRVEEESGRNESGTKAKIVIETLDGSRIKFGTMLREERMKFVAAATRRLLVGNGRK